SSVCTHVSAHTSRRERREKRKRKRSLWNYFSFSLFGSGADPLHPWDRGRLTLGVACLPSIGTRFWDLGSPSCVVAGIDSHEMAAITRQNLFVVGETRADQSGADHENENVDERGPFCSAEA